MAEPRSDIVTTIRTALGGVTGLWTVFYSFMPQEPAPTAPYIVESFAGGNEMDSAIADHSTGKRWRQLNDAYILELYWPDKQGEKVATDMAGAIARAFLNGGPYAITGGKVWFTDYSLAGRPRENGWQKKVCTLRYKAVYTV